MRRAAFTSLGCALALLALRCSGGAGEITCADPIKGCSGDGTAAYVTTVNLSLDPAAVVLSPLDSVPRLSRVHARAYERRDGSSVVTLWGEDLAGAGVSAKTAKASAIAFVGGDGAVVPFVTGTPALDLFQGPPRGVEYGSGALILTCQVGPSTTAWIVDAAQHTLTKSSQLPIGACNTSNSPVRPMLGRALDAGHFVAASGQEMGIYAYQGEALQKVTTFPAVGSFYAWVEEIEPGVLATLSWHNSSNDISGTWTYGRTDSPPGPTFTPDKMLIDAYDQSGLETVRREPSGSLLINTGSVANAGCTSCLGLFRWHVESDGRIESLAKGASAPFGEWSPLGFGRGVAIDLQPNPRATYANTPVRSAGLAIVGDAFDVFGVRASPCADDDMCRRLGETFTLAVVGPPAKRVAIQALWPWADVPSPESAIVVAVPAGSSNLTAGGPDGGAPDGGGADAGCQRTPLASDASTSEAGVGGEHVIASGFPGARWLAADASHAVLATDDAANGLIVDVPLSGGPPSVIASGQKQVGHLAIGYPSAPCWTETGAGTVWSADGCPSAVTTGQGSPDGIGTDGNAFYWTTREGNVMSRAIGGTSDVTVVAGEQSPSALIVAPYALYWIANGGAEIRKHDKTPGAPATTHVTDPKKIVALAQFGTDFYFATGDGRLQHCSLSDCTVPNTLGSGYLALGDVVADATGVYYTESGTGANDGLVLHVPLGALDPMLVATGQRSPKGIATNATSVLWVTSGGELWSAAK